MHHLNTVLEVPLPVEGVFAFFAKAENLGRITPPELRFRIATLQPIDLHVGATIEYELSLYGLPFGWTSLISAWNPERSFVDQQVRGPYRVWVHTHSFERTSAGTIVRDHVVYALPFSPVSEVVIPLIRKQLRRIFTFRQVQVIRELGLDPASCRWSVEC